MSSPRKSSLIGSVIGAVVLVGIAVAAIVVEAIAAVQIDSPALRIALWVVVAYRILSFILGALSGVAKAVVKRRRARERMERIRNGNASVDDLLAFLQDGPIGAKK